LEKKFGYGAYPISLSLSDESSKGLGKSAIRWCVGHCFPYPEETPHDVGVSRSRAAEQLALFVRTQ